MSVPSWALSAQPERPAVASSARPVARRPLAIGGVPSRLARILCVLALTVSAAATTLVPETRAHAQSDDPVAAQATTVATTDLNLRAQPSTESSVLTVIPGGGSVIVTGGNQNGFLPVSYNGVSGFAYADFLGSGPSSSGTPDGGTSGGTAGGRSVLVSLNLRADASTDSQIVAVMPAGATVELLGDQRNGFVSVSYNGNTGWAFGQFLGAGGATSAPADRGADGPTTTGATGPARTTTDLNLRSGAGTSFGVVAVIPVGGQVELLGSQQNNFAQVSYGGNQGWASRDYLATGGGTTPAPDTEPAPTTPAAPSTGTAPSGQVWATSSLNVRSGPGTTYSVLTVMPAGSSATSTEQSQNGFWSLNYNGTVGWASSSLLSTSDPSPESAIPSPGGSSGSYSQDQIIQLIYDAADRYGQPREDMLRVARCESVLDPGAVNAGGQSYGLFQFIPSTWATTPYASYDIFDPWANANAAGWMWEQGRRNEWVCQ